MATFPHDFAYLSGLNESSVGMYATPTRILDLMDDNVVHYVPTPENIVPASGGTSGPLAVWLDNRHGVGLQRTEYRRGRIVRLSPDAATAILPRLRPGIGGFANLLAGVDIAYDAIFFAVVDPTGAVLYAGYAPTLPTKFVKKLLTTALTKPTAPTAPTAPTDAAPTAPTAPMDAAPTDAAPTDAAPTKPTRKRGRGNRKNSAPTDAAPTDAAPTDAAPTDAAPTDAAPTDAAPTDAAPTDAAPTV
jgi:hypothetical protein